MSNFERRKRITVWPSETLASLACPSSTRPKSRVTRSSAPPPRRVGPSPSPQPAGASAQARSAARRRTPSLHHDPLAEGAHQPGLGRVRRVAAGGDGEMRRPAGVGELAGAAKPDGRARHGGAAPLVVVTAHLDLRPAGLPGRLQRQRALAALSLQATVEPGHALSRAQPPPFAEWTGGVGGARRGRLVPDLVHPAVLTTVAIRPNPAHEQAGAVARAPRA